MPSVNRAMQTPVWRIDPVLGSNNNSGTDAAHPLQNYYELAGRWETTEPSLGQDTQIIWLNSQPDSSDPVNFWPTIRNNSRVSMIGQLAPVSTFNLSNVTNKNRPSSQLLQASLTGTGAVSQLVVRASDGSKALANLLVSGTTFSLSQPAVNSFPFTFPSTADDWSNGQQVTTYTQPFVNIVQIGALTEWSPGLVPLEVRQLQVPDPSGAPSGAFIYIGPGVSFMDCVVQRFAIFQNSTGISSWNTNTAFLGGMLGGGIDAHSNQIGFLGGILASGNALMQVTNAYLDMDVIVGNPGGSDLGLLGGPNTYGQVALIGGSLQVYGRAEGGSNFGTGAPVIWGAGALVKVMGDLIYPTSTTAAATFLNGALTLNGLTTAYSINSAQPAVMQGGIPLTPANLDAAQGASGFGGLAFQPGGGRIRKSNSF
jgi:hypothetical protein